MTRARVRSAPYLHRMQKTISEGLARCNEETPPPRGPVSELCVCLLAGPQDKPNLGAHQLLLL